MSGTPTRVLWLAKGLGQGGMERLLVTHAAFGDRERFDYRAAHLVDRPHSVIDELRGLDVPVVRLGRGSGADPRWVVDLVRLVREERIDVVHVHSPLPASVARPVLRVGLPRTRIVYTEHNRWDRFSLPTRLANAATFPLNHRAFAVSDDCRSSMWAPLRGRVRTLTHGIDVDEVAAHREDRDALRAQLGFTDDTVVIGTVANLREQKNYPLMLRAAERLTAEHPEVVFVAAGQGPLEAELRELHGQLGLGDRFRFLGFRPDVHSVMSSFDVFCMSSDHEGLPVALMESKALGLPVVATRVGGIPDAVTDDVDGLLVAPGDLDGLVERLRELVVDPERAERLGTAARTGAHRYDAAVAVREIESVYTPRSDSRS